MATVRHLGLFPFCIGMFPPRTISYDNTQIVFSTGQGTLYPFQLSIQEACAFWWRVKEWKITFTFSEYFDLTIHEEPFQYTGSYVEVLPTTITLIGGQFTDISGGGAEHKVGLREIAEKETDFICLEDGELAAYSYYWEWTAQRVGEITYPPDPQTGIQPPPTPINYTQIYTASLFSNVTQQQGFPPAFVYDVSKDSTTNNPNLWTAFGIQIHNFYSERGYDEYESTAQVKLLGNTVGQLLLGQQFSVNGYTTSMTDVVVEPHEYWPYDPGDDGGPIYNSATGAQLRSFPD